MQTNTYEQILALFAQTSEQLRISSEKAIETDKKLANLAVQVGNITDTLGRFAEEQVRPKILELFKERGIILEETHQRVRVERNGEFFLEIDLLLVNTIYSVVVEVKNTLRQRDVEDHLERLKKLQQYPSRAIKGTTLYGAVAGMIISDEVENFAMEKGLFVLKPKGDNIEISNGANFKPATWDIDADAGK